MKQSCYPALHRGMTDGASEVNRFREQRGLPISPTVDSGKTEPAVFSVYFDGCANWLGRDVPRLFSDLLEIAFAQSTIINRPPVDWADLEMRVLVADESYAILLWMIEACDGGWSGDDIECRNWRAPKWLFMQPLASPPYDHVTAWERMDETETKKALNVIEDRFNQRLIMELEGAVDEAYITLAKRTGAASEGTPSPTAQKSELSTNSRDSSPPIPESKSLSALAQKGRSVLRMREELKKIKSLCRQDRLSMAEIREQHPDFMVWPYADGLPREDRQVFEHPRQWETGYGVNVFLKKYYQRCPATMKKWLAAYRSESAGGAP